MEVKLVVIKGSKKSQVMHLRSEETIVGRQQGCDLRIPSPLVSRRHCRLSIRDNGLVVEDLASANGSLLNGTPVDGQAKVRPGDQLAIGPIVFRVEYGLPVSPKAADAKGSPKVPLRQRAPKTSMAEEPIEMAEVVEEIEEGFPVAGSELVAAAEADGDERTLEFEDMQWRAPPSDDLRDILSDLDEE